MKRFGTIILFGICLWILMAPFGCKHEPIMGDVDSPDTTEVDTMDNDTTDMDTTGMPCDSSVVYFEREILPILRSNCAKSGCHNAASAQEDIILESYQSTMNSDDIVDPFDLDGSDIFEVITEDDPDKRMPRPPNEPLSNDQISLIADWILQGAKNKMCDDMSSCDTGNVSFSATITPILEQNCVGCHNNSVSNGGVNLSNYSGVRTVALDGRLRGVTQWLPGYPMMPQGGNQLPQCELDQIATWIDAGAPNN